MPTDLATILRRAEQFEQRHVFQGYYLERPGGEDLGLEWCQRCVRKALKEEEGEGTEAYKCDPSSDHDSPLQCEECQRWLLGHLTSYGAREELAAFEEHGFSPRRHQDCWLWSLCELCWPSDSDEYRRLLAVAGLQPEAVDAT